MRYGRGTGLKYCWNMKAKGLAEHCYPMLCKLCPKIESSTLHTHPSSYRAIKLYSDMGFKLLTDPIIGTRQMIGRMSAYIREVLASI